MSRNSIFFPLCAHVCGSYMYVECSAVLFCKNLACVSTVALHYSATMHDGNTQCIFYISAMVVNMRSVTHTHTYLTWKKKNIVLPCVLEYACVHIL